MTETNVISPGAPRTGNLIPTQRKAHEGSRSSVVSDRRRPGRLVDASPELVPLMRHTKDVTITRMPLVLAPEFSPDLRAIDNCPTDDLAACKGIGLAVFGSLAMWFGLYKALIGTFG